MELPSADDQLVLSHRPIHGSTCTMRKMFMVAGAALLLAAAAVCSSADGESEARRRAVPAVYVFGDSLVDVGNNDFLPPPAPRAGFPCGVDLPRAIPGGRTGRFTNGYNLADIIAQCVGFDMSPLAYLSLTPQTILDLLSGRVGANYASGGSGILDDTGNGTITLREQIKLFADTKVTMIEANKLGNNRVNRLLSRSLFLISTAGTISRHLVTVGQPEVMHRPTSPKRSPPTSSTSRSCTGWGHGG
ncbi:hypothetical protein VPH35_088659 [Triticum aestivum]